MMTGLTVVLTLPLNFENLHQYPYLDGTKSYSYLVIDLSETLHRRFATDSLKEASITSPMARARNCRASYLKY